MILLLGFLMMTGVAVAQQLQVQGKVTDATGEGLIGASVLVKGTTSGVITDIDGNYVLLNVNPDAILIFSYVGYQTQELNVSGRNKIDVVLHDDQQVLEEVVVVGYGSLSKKEVSSSIVQVDKKNFNLGAMNNPMEMVSGKVAGLNVNTQAAANPNSSSSLQVRGATSVSASNSPLIVIDGVAGGDIRNIAAQDIESITVLKPVGGIKIIDKFI